MANVDIFVGNEVFIDPEIYQLWLSGHSAHEAAQIQQKKGVLQQYGATFDMLLSDTLDHYRTFAILERCLKNPPKLSGQLELKILQETQTILIENYYEFDAPVVREMLGKKLTSRYRNNLDDISEKTHFPLRSCRRQFDNLKRVFKTVEEMTGSLEDNIRTLFLLSPNLAQQYAALVFLTNNRFETGKKKLAYLTFGDFVHCANEMIANWSYSSKDCPHHEDMDQDIQKEFLVVLRDLKALTDREHLEEHRQLVSRNLQSKLSPIASLDLDNSFKSLSKTLINIAYGLNHSKELRDLFLDLVEKFIEPCKQTGWTLSDVGSFLSAYKETGQHLEFFRRPGNRHIMKVWERYITTVSSCIKQMYHS